MAKKGRVLRSYRFALDPNPVQEQQLRSHCGAQRFAYNWGLRLVKANLDQREAERSYGISESDLTPAVSWSAYGMRKLWNQTKADVAPWWPENSKEAYSSGLANLAAALGNWAASRSGRRRGPRMRFPRFKTKNRGCRVGTPPVHLDWPVAQIGATSSCPASDLFAPTNRPGNWQAASRPVPRGSVRRPFRFRVDGGSCRSPWRSSRRGTWRQRLRWWWV